MIMILIHGDVRYSAFGEQSNFPRALACGGVCGGCRQKVACSVGPEAAWKIAKRHCRRHVSNSFDSKIVWLKLQSKARGGEQPAVEQAA